MAMVNPGAEVIADGHIHVYAPLRGKAIAGARGMGDARIFALSMAPELISIAGIYRTSETPWPDAVRGRVNAVNQVFIGASNEVGAFRAGVMATWLGPVGAVAFGGWGIVAIAGLWALLFPKLRKVRQLR